MAEHSIPLPVPSPVKWVNLTGFSTGHFSDVSRAEVHKGSNTGRAGIRCASDASLSLSQQGTLESDTKGQDTGPFTS